MAVENNEYIKFRLIKNDKSSSFEKVIYNKQEFDRLRTWAYHNFFNIYILADQNNDGRLTGYIFDSDAHAEQTGLGDAYRKIIDLKQHLLTKKVKFEEIFTGRGFQVKAFFEPFVPGEEAKAEYQTLCKTYNLDELNLSLNALYRCPYTYNHKAKRWSYPLSGGERVADIDILSKRRLNSNWRFLLRYIHNTPYHKKKRKSNNKKITTKKEFILFLRELGFKVNDNGSGVKCPLAKEHNHNDNDPSCQVTVMKKTNDVKLYCQRQKEGGKFKKHIFNPHNILYYVDGLKYPEAQQKVNQIFERIEKKQEVEIWG